MIAPSERTPWFDGQSLLEFLETVEVERDAPSRAFRFPVQLVLRPTHEFRGYAGQILSGSVRRGDVGHHLADRAVVAREADRHASTASWRWHTPASPSR